METHPDRNGGDDTEFRRVQAAYELLSDPDRRRRYDETGEDRVKRPGAELAAALEVIYSIAVQVMGNIEQSGRKLDLTKINFAAELKAFVVEAVKQQKEKIKVVRRAAEQLEVAAGRFKTDDRDSPINRVLKDRADHLREQQAVEENALDELNAADNLLRKTTYTHDKEEMKWGPATGRHFVNVTYTLGG